MNCEIIIHTSLYNLSNKMENLLNKFKNITYFIGIDGINEIFNYQKTYMNFDKFINNINKVSKNKKIIFQYGINKFNALSFIEDIFFLIKNIKCKKIFFEFYILNEPYELSLKYINANFKKKIINYINSNLKNIYALEKISNLDINHVIDFINNNFKCVKDKEFIEFCKKYDNTNNVIKTEYIKNIFNNICEK